MSSLVLSSSAQLPSELDYQTTLAAAGYAAGFVERCPLRDARSSSHTSSASSIWSRASSFVHPYALSSRRPSSRWSASSSVVIEELLDAALAVDRRPAPATSSAGPSRPSSFIAAPRPLSIAESTRSVLLAGPSTSPTPSFMSALSAGEFHRKQRQRQQQQDVAKSASTTSNAPPSRRSMSPVISVGSSSLAARPSAHWRAPTLSPPPPRAGPPPTCPLPPTPTTPSQVVPAATRHSATARHSKRASTTSQRSRKGGVDDIARQRAEARAALEGRSPNARSCTSA